MPKSKFNELEGCLIDRTRRTTTRAAFTHLRESFQLKELFQVLWIDSWLKEKTNRIEISFFTILVWRRTKPFDYDQ